MSTPTSIGYDHDYVRAKAPIWKRRLHRYFRAQINGIENCPNTPFLAVGNHSGGILIPDTLVWLSAYHEAQREPPLLTLAHDAFFNLYPTRIRNWAKRFGAIRAHYHHARTALEQGYAVQVYPGGDDDACRPFSKRNHIEFAGRMGYVRLAQEANVPIVPVVSYGGHKSLIVLRSGKRLARWLGTDSRFRLRTFPISFCVPWGLWFGPMPGYIPFPTKICIEVCPPISPVGDPIVIDSMVRKTMQAALNRRCT